jgi:nitrite reductase/ring-hydroxylating ferredoxin subunit
MSTTEKREPRLYAAAEALAEVDALDGVADAIASKLRDLAGGTAFKNALTGSWLGHPLHPVLTDVAIGTWTSATLLDWVGGRASEPAARRLLGIGVTAAVPTILSGWMDYIDSIYGNPQVKRVGIVHAFANATATTLFGTSLAARRNGAIGRGKALALAGVAVTTVSAYLGGHLSFGNAVGVDQTAFEDPESDWTDVLATGELGERTPRYVEAHGIGVLVVREGGELFALSDRCSHRGGPLHEGKLEDGCVVCPLHGSTFRLRDGSLVRGPSPYPQPLWEARERAGRVEVRPAGQQ